MANSLTMLDRLSKEIQRQEQKFHDNDFKIKESKVKGIELDESTLDKPTITKDQLKSLKIIETAMKNIKGDFNETVTIKEAITTTDAFQMIPNFIVEDVREAVEPILLGTSFFTKIQLPPGAGTTYVVPVLSELQAAEVGEAQKYNTDAINQNTIEAFSTEIKVKKIGIKVGITEEAYKENTFDIYAMSLRAMGRAMARYKESEVFRAFSNGGFPVFDNSYRDSNEKKFAAEVCTTGRAIDGSYNDTMSTEDFLNFVLALISQGKNPTDVILHPLTWVVFSKNAVVGNGLTFGALGGGNVHPWGAIQGTSAPLGFSQNSNAGQKMILGPGQVQNRLPLPGINLSLSPEVAYDKYTKRFDMYCLDRNNVGVIGQKTPLSQDEWTENETDIKYLKMKERYGFALHDNGNGIVTARNLAADVTYPVAPEVTINTKAL